MVWVDGLRGVTGLTGFADNVYSLQAHPEFTSKVIRASPPFLGFVAASAGILGDIMKDLEQRGLTNGTDAHF